MPAPTAAPGPAAEAAPFAAAIDALFADLARDDAPGCAVGVFRAGEPVFAKGYGLASLEHGVRITPATRFNVASVAKSFTAFAVTLLEQRGKLSLDDDIRRHVPELPDMGGTVTVRHLMHHTSGIRAYEDLLMLSGWNRDHPLSREQAMEAIGRQRELNFPPGERYMYGNSNYILLAMIVERADGRPFGEFMAREVFEPLGMTRTFVRADPMAIIRDRADHYWKTPGGGFRRNQIWAFAYATGASNVITTVEDLARWDANLAHGRIGGPGMEALLRRRFRLNSGDSIGSGAALSAHRGLPIVAFSGGGGGDYSMVRFPGQRFTSAVLCNVEGAGARGRALRIADLFLHDDFPAEVPGDVAAPATVSAAELLPFVGEYRDVNDPLFLLHFSIEGGTLAGRLEGDTLARWSVPAGDSTFRIAEMTLVFGDVVAGAARRLTITHPNGTNRLVRAGPVWAPAAAELAAFEGAYRSAELDAVWELRVADGALTVTRPRFPSRTVVPLSRDVLVLADPFEDETLVSHLAFERGPDGRVIAFRLSGERVARLRFLRTTSR